LFGETNLRGLFVCGEAASTGVMGANRLASNSLLECIVFGKRASEKAAQLIPHRCSPGKIQPFTVSPEYENTFVELKNEMANLMSLKLGIVRNRTIMLQALQRLDEIYEMYRDHKNDYNLLKIKNIAEICRLIGKAAIIREESRGGHVREDFPDEDPHFRVHIIQEKGNNALYEPVKLCDPDLSPE
jgi:L-aspartate oxidase